jgi:hypothetical protein
MTPRWPAALATDHAPHLLPLLFAAALIGGLAIQARLMPLRPILMEIPSTIGIAPGAAPQESLAPEPPISPAIVPSSVLPSESQPSDSSPSSGEISSAGPAFVTERQSEAWSDRLPREIEPDGASGNVKIRSRQPTSISLLVASIMQSLKRIHPLAPPRSLAAVGMRTRVSAAQNRSTFRSTARANVPKPSLAGWGVGGPAPQRAILGGPTPLAARYAPSINGMTLRRP